MVEWDATTVHIYDQVFLLFDDLSCEVSSSFGCSYSSGSSCSFGCSSWSLGESGQLGTSGVSVEVHVIVRVWDPGPNLSRKSILLGSGRKAAQGE